ncbi:MAG: DUF1080 domain-containing protein [Planctomycetota bacterium]
MYLFRLASICTCCIALCFQTAQADEYLTGIKWAEPPVIKPGASDSAAPSDAIVLFNGKDLKNWKNGERWTVKEGLVYAGKGKITSMDEFGDCQIHIEWSSPIEVKGNGQGRGNSGIFMMGIYELQVLDSYNNPTYFDGQAGAIYKQRPPMVNAMRPPGEWNSYDIIWTAPRFNEDGSLKSPAFITAMHNGVLIQNHFELLGDTPFNRPPQYKKHGETGPISIQDHGNPVRFRNIWVRPLNPIQGEQTRDPFIKKGDKEIPIPKQPETKRKLSPSKNAG